MASGKSITHKTGSRRVRLPKAPTGIAGLDEITFGGLPQGRPTLVAGGPGCGKTLLASQFLAKGVTDFDEPGVFVAFEEKPDELAQNVRSLGFDFGKLIAQKKLAVDFIHLERSEIDETGEYDLEGLFVRLAYAIDSIGAKRIVLDTIETMFGGLTNHLVLRAELRRLFRWLKDRGMTAIITCERGDGMLSKYGLEEYVSDCVILLDHRVQDQVSTRRLRVVKYRGSPHGTDEYPFLIDDSGLSVVPITSVGNFDVKASQERVSTGVARLDEMLGGKGYFRGSNILVTGGAGTGKTSLAAHFAVETARRGEKALYVAFEESQDQLIRNMRSIGLDLESPVKKGRLQFLASRPTRHGLEMHLAVIHQIVDGLQPTAVIVDPISNLMVRGTATDAGAMLVRLLDFLRSRQITVFLTSLISGEEFENTDLGVSSIVDSWLMLRNVEQNGERTRSLSILKSRGMPHSNQVREFALTDNGVDLAADRRARSR